MNELSRAKNHPAAAIAKKRCVEAAELNQHEQANTSDKPYSCSNCEEIFAQSVELSKHEEAYKSVSHFKLQEYIIHLSYRPVSFNTED